MKIKALCLVAAMSVMLVACKDDTDKHKESALIVPRNSSTVSMPVLARNNGCIWCHDIDKRLVGPSWMDVSEFYNGKTAKTPTGKTLKDVTGDLSPEEFLIMKISKGGHGNWGTAEMIANDPSGAKQPAVKELAGFILGLSK